MMNTFFSDLYYLSIRNIKLIWRPLLALLPPLFIPVFFFIVNSAALKSITLVPGFPAESYQKFIAPVALFSAIFFSAGNAGIELVVDITSGYFKKLLIMPISHLAIILSKLIEIGVQSVIQGVIVLTLLLAIGIKVEAGFTGLLMIFVIMVIFAMGWSCIGMISALQTQNPRLVQSLFILAFPLLYITTGQAPRELLSGTFLTLVNYNPVTYILEAVRTLMIKGWGYPEIWQGLGVSVGLFLVLLIAALLSFKKVLK